jgi:hypothetical protein
MQGYPEVTLGTLFLQQPLNRVYIKRTSSKSADNPMARLSELNILAANPQIIVRVYDTYIYIYQMHNT